MMEGLENMSYCDRTKDLAVYLTKKRLRGDLITIYKYVHGEQKLMTAHCFALADKGCDKVQPPEDESGQPQMRRKWSIFKQEDN